MRKEGKQYISTDDQVNRKYSSGSNPSNSSARIYEKLKQQANQSDQILKGLQAFDNVEIFEEYGKFVQTIENIDRRLQAAATRGTRTHGSLDASILNENIGSFKDAYNVIIKDMEELLKLRDTLQDSMHGDDIERIGSILNSKKVDISRRDRASKRASRVKNSSIHKNAYGDLGESYTSNMQAVNGAIGSAHRDDMKRGLLEYYKDIDQGFRKSKSKYESNGAFTSGNAEQSVNDIGNRLQTILTDVRQALNASVAFTDRHGANAADRISQSDLIRAVKDVQSGNIDSVLSRHIGGLVSNNRIQTMSNPVQTQDIQHMSSEALDIVARAFNDIRNYTNANRNDESDLIEYNQVMRTRKNNDKYYSGLASSEASIQKYEARNPVDTESVDALNAFRVQMETIKRLNTDINRKFEQSDEILRSMYTTIDAHGNSIVDVKSLERASREMSKMSAEWEKMSSGDKNNFNNSFTDFATSRTQGNIDRIKAEHANKMNKVKKNATKNFNDTKAEAGTVSVGHLMSEDLKSISKMTVGFYAIGRAVSFMTQSHYELEKSIYSLGIVGGATKTEIESLRYQLLEMSETSVYSASELTESLDQVVKTGKTLAEAKEIVKETEKLAAASFETLDFATSSVNKAMIAFEIGSSRAGEIVQQYYNAAAATPLSLRSLDESLRNAASSFASVADFTNRSGTELEDYKVAVNGTAAALTGRHNAPYKC